MCIPSLFSLTSCTVSVYCAIRRHVCTQKNPAVKKKSGKHKGSALTWLHLTRPRVCHKQAAGCDAGCEGLEEVAESLYPVVFIGVEQHHAVSVEFQQLARLVDAVFLGLGPQFAGLEGVDDLLHHLAACAAVQVGKTAP